MRFFSHFFPKLEETIITKNLNYLKLKKKKKKILLSFWQALNHSDMLFYNGSMNDIHILTPLYMEKSKGLKTKTKKSN